MDDIDLKILQELQRDGRQTNARLAETLGLSQSATLERVRRLERDGSILGYRAVVAPAALGIGLQAFVAAELNEHSQGCIRQFEAGIAAVPGVRACYHIAGRFDYLLHVAVPDLERLGRLIKADIAAIPGVSRLETMLVFSEARPDQGWPVMGDD
jgi:Lrp/AsnC family leucine-responsive transcriptional regulator